MIDKKEIEISKRLIKQFINENKIISPKLETKKCYLDNAINSLRVAKRLMMISDDHNDGLYCFLWVINISYYSMYYSASALLAFLNKKIDSEIGIHKITYYALLFYCYIDNNRLQKHFINEYKDQYENAKELLEISEIKSIEFINDLKYEINKRKIFTYNVGMAIERKKAMTSLRRAENFLIETRKIIEN